MRVRIAEGEALDSWLLRLAHRNGVPLHWLAHQLGLSGRLKIWRNYALTKAVPGELLRRIETQTGLSADTLDAAVLDQFDALGWTPIPGSRYCPKCLTENGGWWPLRWQLPHTFACPAHQCLLVVLCPSCGRIPRSRISQRSGIAAATTCTMGATRHARPCDADLLATARPVLLPAGDPRLAAQAWVNQRLDCMGAAAVTDLRDLDAITSWLPWRVTPADLRHLGPETVAAVAAHCQGNNALIRNNPAAGLMAAAMACHAIDIISTGPGACGDEHQRAKLAPFTRDIHNDNRRDRRPATSLGGLKVLSVKRLTGLSAPLAGNVLRGIDEDLSATERLRYRTGTCAPRLPDQGPGTVADRARGIPQRLWPDWVVRFHPATRPARSADVAVTVASALLIPGNPARNNRAAGELTRWRPDMGVTLSNLARSHPDVLTAVCHLAEYLDTHPTPIDYRRRRAMFTTIDLADDEWKALCIAGQVHAGHGSRLLHARQHLFALLTGSDLGDPRHLLAHATPKERNRHEEFERQMPTALRTALHDHAAALLAAAGIDEPVTWSPPAHTAAGLDLPGREPDDIDTALLHHLVLDEHTQPSAAARILKVSTPYACCAATRLHGQVPDPGLPPRRPTGTRARTRAHAERLLTAEFFQREFTEAGKNIATIATETGISREMVRDYAKRAGIQLSIRRPLGERITNPGAVRGNHIDPDWLREQAGTLRRSNTDIARELGVAYETVRKLRRKLEIPPIRTGTFSDRRYPELPNEIRRAVEGRRSGWQRLRRLEDVTAHHSINRAAAALGRPGQNLNLQIQRLEADLGAPLLIRGHRYQPIAPTPLGQRVLDQLQRPDVRALLDKNAPPGERRRRRPSGYAQRPSN